MINNLLPKKENLIPVDNSSMFRECEFKDSFDSLSFEKKLQVINDLVRQSILPNTRPDSNTHLETGIGNCHTASLIAINYLKYLNIGKNHRYVMARIKPFEPDDVLSKHSLVLLDDDNNITYQFDATPFVGYKYGKVARLDQDRFYKEYILVDDKIRIQIDKIFDLLLAAKNKTINDSNIDYYNCVLLEAINYPVLNGYVYSCTKALLPYQTSEYGKKIIQEIAVRVNSYHKSLDNYEEKNNYRKSLVLKQIRNWEEELNELIIADKDYKRQLELVQMITQEKVFYDEKYEKKILIDGEEFHLSHLTPRFFYEKNLGVSTEGKIGHYYLNDYSQDTGILISKFAPTNNSCFGLETDGMNPTDTALVYLTGYPEHQLMTKYMYPNKILCKKKNN